MTTEMDIYTNGYDCIVKDAKGVFKSCSRNSEDLSIFIRGIFDRYGDLNSKTFLNDSPVLVIQIDTKTNTSLVIDIFDKLKEILWIEGKLVQNDKIITYELRDYNALDFLSKIYDNSDARFRNVSLYDRYTSWVSDNNLLPTCKFFKTDDLAVNPSKGRASDVGWDLTIIKLVKQLGKNTFMYDTGIVVSPDFGYYTKIVPRSSLVKSGYVLSNSIGVIDGTFRGSLKVVLTKVDDSFPDLVLPFKCVQLIIDRHIHYKMVRIEEESELGETTRGDGGFGSTNKK